MLAWAAMIDGHEAASYDQTGAAQKWGAVLSSLIVAPAGTAIATNKVGCGKADLYLAVDPMAAADRVNLDRCVQERTAALVNTNLLPTGTMIRDSYTEVSLDPMVELIARHTDASRSAALDARAIAEGLFGDYMATNMVAVGAAYQAGLLPISASSIEAAIELNGTAVKQNLQAFRYGRLAHAAPDRVAAVISPSPPSTTERIAAAREELPARARADFDTLIRPAEDLPEDLRVRFAIRVGELIQFQNTSYANEYATFVLAAFDTERGRLGDFAAPKVTAAVIDNLFKVMAYKDEYEVARLHLRSSRDKRVTSMFDGEVKVTYHLHPPVLRALGMDRKLQIPARVLDPTFKMLYAMRRLRGTRMDAAGIGKVRRTERELVPWYRSTVLEALAELKLANQPVVAEIAALPEDIRGYEDVKMANVERAQVRAAELKSRLRSAIMLPLFTAESVTK
jgi:indolepyruvate ferredoxin oxidoreductase